MPQKISASMRHKMKRSADAKVAGSVARRNGRPISDCPFHTKAWKSGGHYRELWIEGWSEADKQIEFANGEVELPS